MAVSEFYLWGDGTGRSGNARLILMCFGKEWSSTVRSTRAITQSISASERKRFPLSDKVSSITHIEDYFSTSFFSRMYSVGKSLLRRWHGMLGLSRQSPLSWYRDRLREELRERRIASTPWRRLSETSDVLFSISRASFDGFPVRRLPFITGSRHVLVYAYMLAKYTSRWKFYRVAARLCRAPQYSLVREVVNPAKDHKLDEVASRHQIDRAQFKRVSRQLRRVWPLLP